MKKILFLCVVIFLFLFLLARKKSDVFAFDKSIRIGLESQKDMTIKNKTICVDVGDKNKNLVLKTKTNFKVNFVDGIYVKHNRLYDNYDEALKTHQELAKKNIKTTVCMSDTNLYFLCSELVNNYIEFPDVNKNFSDQIINSQEEKMLALSNGENIIFFDKNNIKIKSSDSNLIELGDKKYYGELEFYYDPELKKTIAVNILDFDKYLACVVGTEMPFNWPDESLKAQAIALRTYILKNMKAKKHKHYDLCDKCHCQIYHGFKNNFDLLDRIIAETNNLCIYYNNELIDAVFFSSSGGATEDSENVWNNKLDYLRGKKNGFDLKEISKTWTHKFYGSQIKKMLSQKNIDIGDILGAEIREVLPSGRVNKLLLLGTNGEKMLVKEEIRNFFRCDNGQILESRMFDMNSQIYLDENNNFDCVLEFNGKGCGHGVGMSQYGAKALAESGCDFETILKYYYTGVQIK